MATNPDCIFIGAGKTGSTWLWHCFRHHPQVFVHEETDSTRYYSFFYHLKDRSWYEALFADAGEGQVVVEMCNDYLDDTQSPERIYQDNPDAKLIVCLREPIERGFSHYWHGKKKNDYVYEYGDAIRKRIPYTIWLKPGFYADHLERYFGFFKRERILVLYYDELKADPQAFLRKVWDFIGVDDFRPPVVDRRVNAAAPRSVLARTATSGARRALDKLGLLERAQRIQNAAPVRKLQERLFANDEYASGIPPELRAEMLRVTLPEVEKLEKLLGVDLSHWKR